MRILILRVEGTHFGILRITDFFLKNDESEYGSDDYTDDETEDEEDSDDENQVDDDDEMSV